MVKRKKNTAAIIWCLVLAALATWLNLSIIGLVLFLAAFGLMIDDMKHSQKTVHKSKRKH